MYLSLDLIMKSEEPMVFSNCKDRLRIIMHNYEQEQAEKSASFEYYIRIFKSYCLCCCEVLRPQLFLDFTLGLEKKKVSESVNVVILWCWLPTSC